MELEDDKNIGNKMHGPPGLKGNIAFQTFS